MKAALSDFFAEYSWSLETYASAAFVEHECLPHPGKAVFAMITA